MFFYNSQVLVVVFKKLCKTQKNDGSKYFLSYLKGWCSTLYQMLDSNPEKLSSPVLFIMSLFFVLKELSGLLFTIHKSLRLSHTDCLIHSYSLEAFLNVKPCFLQTFVFQSTNTILKINFLFIFFFLFQKYYLQFEYIRFGGTTTIGLVFARR